MQIVIRIHLTAIRLPLQQTTNRRTPVLHLTGLDTPYGVQLLHPTIPPGIILKGQKMNRNITLAAAAAIAIAPGFAVGQSVEDTQLWTSWVALWNGDYSVGSEVVAPSFDLHASLLGGQDPSAFNTPDGLVSLIDQIRTAIPDLVFTVKVGPIIADGYVVGHWNATGHFAGHFPGATAEVGAEVSFNGTDILRIEDGKVAEYWLVSDTLDLVTQFGVAP